MPHYHDDEPGRYLDSLQPRRMVTLTCPYCPHRVHGLDEKHAAQLLLIHQEGTCQGAEGGDQT